MREKRKEERTAFEIPHFIHAEKRFTPPQAFKTDSKT